jgi:hypothetical protein
LKANHIFIALLSLEILIVPWVFASSKQTYLYTYTLTYNFQNRGDISTEISLEDVIVPRFMNTTWQIVYLKESTDPYTTTDIDKDGNQGLLINIERDLAPGEETGFTVVYHIESKERSIPSINRDDAEGIDKIPNRLIQEYTNPTETFMADNLEISSLSRRLTEGEETVLGKTLALMEYLIETTEYETFEYPLYPNQTLITGKGDCDDQSILLISMLRSLGVPAYLQVGIVIHPNIKETGTNWDGHFKNIKEGVGWHGWAMIFIPPWGWVPVDLVMAEGDDLLEIIKKAPQYQPNLILAGNISDQLYIGETLKTMDRIVASSIYISITDKGKKVYSNSFGNQTWLLFGLGLGVTAAIMLMFCSKD